MKQKSDFWRAIWEINNPEKVREQQKKALLDAMARYGITPKIKN